MFSTTIRKMALRIIILFMVFVTPSRFEEDVPPPGDEHVLVLNDDNFADTIDSNPYILVEFYAPWCQHCKALAVEFGKAAQRLHDEQSNLLLAKVDATAETKLSKKYAVKSYPTLKLFRGDTEDFVDYNAADRSSDTIVTWMRKKSGPSATEVTSEEELESIRLNNRAVLVGFFKDKTDVPIRAFKKAADSLDSTICVYTTDPVLFRRYKIDKPDEVILLKQYDQGRHDMNEELSVVQIKNFAIFNQLEIVVDFSTANGQNLFQQEVIQKFVLLFLSSQDERLAELKETLRGVAYNHRNEYLFAVIDSESPFNAKVLNYFGVTDKQNPSLCLADMSGNEVTKFKPDVEDFSAAGIETFILGVEREMIPKYLKVQQLPDDWNDNPVKILTGQNFDEVVNNESQDVFVEFYAPWCGHCKKLEPIWDELAEYFEGRADIIIAKIDSTANELDGLKIPSFPTLMLYPKDKGEVLPYEGVRELQPLIDFVDNQGRENAKEEL